MGGVLRNWLNGTPRERKKKHPAQVIIRPWEKETFDASNYFLLLLLESSRKVPLYFSLLSFFHIFGCFAAIFVFLFWFFSTTFSYLGSCWRKSDLRATRPLLGPCLNQLVILFIFGWARAGWRKVEPRSFSMGERETQFSFLFISKRRISEINNNNNEE